MFILLVFKLCPQGLILSYIFLKFFKYGMYCDVIELFIFGRKFCIKLFLSLFCLVLLFGSVDAVRYYTSSTTKCKFFVVKNKDNL